MRPDMKCTGCQNDTFRIKLCEDEHFVEAYECTVCGETEEVE